jgi:biopolymer transport protein ExbD
MPVKLGSKLPAESEARIEIIPLIDIMFFLLAAFMLVSLSMVNLKGLRVELPIATSATAETSRNLVNITVDKAGLIYLERQPVGSHELATALAAMWNSNPGLRVFVSGDREARHGDVIRVLDVARGAGIEKVAFEIREPSGPAPR